jgi:hypothetical protein
MNYKQNRALKTGRQRAGNRQRAEYLGHLPDGHHTIQSFLKPLVILLLWRINGKRRNR